MITWEQIFKRKEWKHIVAPDPSVVDLIPLLRKNKLKRILDLGCGNGRHMIYLGKRGFTVVGTDISSTALSLAQEWLEKEKIKNYCLVENDMIKLPFPDNHFDAVISIRVIYHNPLPKIKKVIK